MRGCCNLHLGCKGGVAISLQVATKCNKVATVFSMGLIFQGCGEGTTHAVRSFPDVFGTTFGTPLCVHMRTSMLARGYAIDPPGNWCFAWVIYGRSGEVCLVVFFTCLLPRLTLTQENRGTPADGLSCPPDVRRGSII